MFSVIKNVLTVLTVAIRNLWLSRQKRSRTAKICQVIQMKQIMKQGAAIDPTGLYRYSLWREWDANAPRVAFIMLNPSRADANTDDPTLRRCLGFARSWGCGSIEVVNLFAYRASRPDILRVVLDPVGPENDRYLRESVERADRIIVAWGNRGSLRNRYQTVSPWLSKRENLYCLGITQRGHPRHPLYVRSTTIPLSYPH